MTHPDGPNEGHGHVFPRADGVRMRHRPETCAECRADAELKASMDAAEIPIGGDGTRIAIDPAPPTTPVQGQRQFKLNAARRLAQG